jgi:hypothetical protein
MEGKIDIEEMTAILRQVLQPHIDDIRDDFKELRKEFVALAKEVSDSRQHLLVKQEQVEGKVDKYEVGAMQARIDANKAVEVSEKTTAEIDQKIRDCRESEGERVQGKIKFRPSFAQIVSLCMFLLLLTGLSNGMSLITYQKTVSIEQVLTKHLIETAQIQKGNNQ